VKILSVRIKESGITNMISQKEIEWLSNECAADGDARLAIQAMNNAIIHARRKNKDLTMAEIRNGLKDVRSKTLLESLQSLDTDSLLILYVLSDGITQKLQNDVYPIYKKACAIFKIDAQSHITIWRKIDSLSSYGYVNKDKGGHLGRHGGPQRIISISPVFADANLRYHIEGILTERVLNEKH
jgi:Cdc6-like AAA superfamily ATPase